MGGHFNKKIVRFVKTITSNDGEKMLEITHLYTRYMYVTQIWLTVWILMLGLTLAFVLKEKGCGTSNLLSLE